MKIILSVIFASVISLAIGAFGGYKFYEHVANQSFASVVMGHATSQTIAHHKITTLLEEEKYDEAKNILSILVETDLEAILDLSSQIEAGPNNELIKVSEKNKSRLNKHGISLEPNKSLKNGTREVLRAP